MLWGTFFIFKTKTMKNTLKCTLVLLILTLTGSTVYAQEMLLDGHGKPIIIQQQYVEIKGNPYSTEDWEEAVIYADNGAKYANVKLRYDMVAEQLLYRDSRTDQVFVLNLAVDSFAFVNHNANTSFVKLADGKFYERLVDGQKYKLYKKVNKNIIENQAYGSGEKTKVIVEKTQYYYETQGKLERIQPNRRSVLRIVSGGDRNKLDDFLKSNTVNITSEQGLVQAFNFLNK